MPALSLLQRGFEWLAVALMLILFATSVSASEPSNKGSNQSSFWHPWFEIGGYHNSRDEDSTGTRGTNRGETTIFAPIRGGNGTLLFGQMTAKFFDDTAKEGNLAFGYRRMTTSGFNLGAWIGGDARLTDINNNFWQLSGGFEALSKNVDMRLNWYGPVSKPQSGVAGYAQVQLQGNQIFMTGGEEVGMKGVDGEVGFRLPTENLRINPNIFELRAYGGGYHFYSDDAEDNVTGVKGRLELRVNDVIASLPGSRLTVDYEVSHDDVRDTRHDVGLRVRIPLNGSKPAPSLASLSHQQRRMLDGIERDTDIVTGRSKRENVEDALTGTDFDRVAYATTEVTTTSNTAGDNSLIILNGTVTGSQEIQANQTMQGGGSTIQVRGRRTGLVVPFTAPGTAGRLETPTTNGDNLQLNGSNIHISGITIVGNLGDPGDPGPGNEGNGVSMWNNHKNIFLTNLEISKTWDSGILAGSDNEVEITGVTLKDIDADAINFESDNIVVIDDVTITSSSDVSPPITRGGIDFDDGNTVVITNTNIKDINGIGIDFGSDNTSIQISGTSITNTNGRNALEFSGGNSNIVISNVTIEGDGNGSVNAAIELGLSNVAVIWGLHVDGSDRGINMVARGAEANISNSTFANIGGKVFDSGNEATWSLRNSVVNGADDDVFELGTDDKLFVEGNTFTGDIGGNIFSFERANAVVETGSTGNVNNTTSGNLCEASGSGSFTGSIEFVDGTVLQDNVSPCN